MTCSSNFWVSYFRCFWGIILVAIELRTKIYSLRQHLSFWKSSLRFIKRIERVKQLSGPSYTPSFHPQRPIQQWTCSHVCSLDTAKQVTMRCDISFIMLPHCSKMSKIAVIYFSQPFVSITLASVGNKLSFGPAGNMKHDNSSVPSHRRTNENVNCPNIAKEVTMCRDFGALHKELPCSGREHHIKSAADKAATPLPLRSRVLRFCQQFHDDSLAFFNFHCFNNIT